MRGRTLAMFSYVSMIVQWFQALRYSQGHGPRSRRCRDLRERFSFKSRRFWKMTTRSRGVLRISGLTRRAAGRLISSAIGSTHAVQRELSSLRSEDIGACQMSHSQRGWSLNLPRSFQRDRGSILRSGEMVRFVFRLRPERRVLGCFYDCDIGSNICVEFLAI